MTEVLYCDVSLLLELSTLSKIRVVVDFEKITMHSKLNKGGKTLTRNKGNYILSGALTLCTRKRCLILFIAILITLQ